MTGATALGLDRRGEVPQLLRFCVVGAVGFLVDAALLQIGVTILHLDPISARLVSVSVAIVATYALNRIWAFRSARDAGPWRAFARYLAVQGCGFLCNFATYTLLMLAMPAPLNLPLLCLAVASAVALAVNYLGARLVVFRR